MNKKILFTLMFTPLVFSPLLISSCAQSQSYGLSWKESDIYNLSELHKYSNNQDLKIIKNESLKDSERRWKDFYYLKDKSETSLRAAFNISSLVLKIINEVCKKWNTNLYQLDFKKFLVDDISFFTRTYIDDADKQKKIRNAWQFNINIEFQDKKKPNHTFKFKSIVGASEKIQVVTVIPLIQQIENKNIASLKLKAVPFSYSYNNEKEIIKKEDIIITNFDMTSLNTEEEFYFTKQEFIFNLFQKNIGKNVYELKPCSSISEAKKELNKYYKKRFTSIQNETTKLHIYRQLLSIIKQIILQSIKTTNKNFDLAKFDILNFDLTNIKLIKVNQKTDISFNLKFSFLIKFKYDNLEHKINFSSLSNYSVIKPAIFSENNQWFSGIKIENSNLIIDSKQQTLNNVVFKDYFENSIAKK